MVKMFLALLTPILVASSTVALADNLEVYGKVGIPGAGVGIGMGVNDNVAVRADITTLGSAINRDFKQGNIEYDAEVKATQGTIAIDYFPSSNSSFRLTTGVGIGRVKVNAEGHSLSSGTVRIGGTRYSYDTSDSITAEIKYPDLMPYFGIGIGHNAKAKKAGTWSFNGDLGVYVGNPKTNFEVSQSLYDKMLRASGGNADSVAADVERERKRVEDKAGDLWVIPTVTLGVSYYF